MTLKLPKPDTTARLVSRKTRLRPALGIVLGSGFHGVTAQVEAEAHIPYSKLPGFPPTGVSGHSGELIIGTLNGTPCAILSGRSHYYEGRSMAEVTFATRVLAALGVTDILLTNAAGGINNSFKAGDLMVLTDHINLMGVNPLRAFSAPGLQRFVDMTVAYDPGLASLLGRAAAVIRLKLRAGVYLAVSGPSYETPAEIRAFAALGADAVGMSTVPEAVVARQLGMRVAGLSCITNLAAGRGKEPLSHAEVLETGRRVQKTATQLLSVFAKLYAER